MTDRTGNSEDHQVFPAPRSAPAILGTSESLAGLATLTVSPEAVRILPVEFVKRHRVLPVELRNGTLRVATADPGNQRVVDDIRLLSGMEVAEFAAAESEILEKISECYQVTVERMIE